MRSAKVKKSHFLMIRCMLRYKPRREEMSRDWQELTAMTRDGDFLVERVRLAGCETAIEGQFELPPLARLSAEDQVFLVAFVRCHGSIKQMERLFGVSYPTIRKRLERLSAKLEFVEIETAPAGQDPLERLERGEITVDEAVEMLRS